MLSASVSERDSLSNLAWIALAVCGGPPRVRECALVVSFLRLHLGRDRFQHGVIVVPAFAQQLLAGWTNLNQSFVVVV